MKFILITLFFIYLVYKVAGFVVRLFLRQAGIRFMHQSQQTRPTPEPARGQRAGQPDGTRSGHITDNLGEYVEYEEVK